MKIPLFKPLAARGLSALFCFVLILPCGSRAADDDATEDTGAMMRVWTSKRGTRVEAAYERLSFDSVRVRTPSGKPLTLPLESLSEIDMNYLRTVVIPEVSIKTSSKSEERPKCRVAEFYDAYSVDETFKETLTVKVEKESSFPFDGTLRAEVYLIGDEMNTEHHRLVARKTFPVTFTEENDEVCEFSFSGYFRAYSEYNGPLPGGGATRGCEYAGYVLIVTDQNSDIMLYDTNLSYLDGDFNDEELAAKIKRLRGFREFTFFRDSVKRGGVPRPEFYEGRIN